MAGTALQLEGQFADLLFQLAALLLEVFALLPQFPALLLELIFACGQRQGLVFQLGLPLLEPGLQLIATRFELLAAVFQASGQLLDFFAFLVQLGLGEPLLVGQATSQSGDGFRQLDTRCFFLQPHLQQFGGQPHLKRLRMQATDLAFERVQSRPTLLDGLSQFVDFGAAICPLLLQLAISLRQLVLLPIRLRLPFLALQPEFFRLSSQLCGLPLQLGLGSIQQTLALLTRRLAILRIAALLLDIYGRRLRLIQQTPSLELQLLPLRLLTNFEIDDRLLKCVGIAFDAFLAILQRAAGFSEFAIATFGVAFETDLSFAPGRFFRFESSGTGVKVGLANLKRLLPGKRGGLAFGDAELSPSQLVFRLRGPGVQLCLPPVQLPEAFGQLLVQLCRVRPQLGNSDGLAGRKLRAFVRHLLTQVVFCTRLTGSGTMRSIEPQKPLRSRGLLRLCATRFSCACLVHPRGPMRDRGEAC